MPKFHRRAEPTARKVGWTRRTTEFCPFIEAYSFTGLLAPKEEKKTTKPQIKKEHWRWEEATGTEAKQTMAGKGGSKLQRGSLAEDAQRADCRSSLSRDGTQAARSQHARIWDVGLVEPKPLGAVDKPPSCLVNFHFGETELIRQDGVGEGAQVLMARS